MVGDMANGENNAAEIQVKVLIRGKTTITNVASASAATTDPVAGNNSASITVTVAPGGNSVKGSPKK